MHESHKPQNLHLILDYDEAKSWNENKNGQWQGSGY